MKQLKLIKGRYARGWYHITGLVTKELAREITKDLKSNGREVATKQRKGGIEIKYRPSQKRI